MSKTQENEAVTRTTHREHFPPKRKLDGSIKLNYHDTPISRKTFIINPLEGSECLKFQVETIRGTMNGDLSIYEFKNIDSSAFYNMTAHQFLHFLGVINKADNYKQCSSYSHHLAPKYINIYCPNLEELGYKKVGYPKMSKARGVYGIMQEVRLIADTDDITVEASHTFTLLLYKGSDSKAKLYEIPGYSSEEFRTEKYIGNLINKCRRPLNNVQDDEKSDEAIVYIEEAEENDPTFPVIKNANHHTNSDILDDNAFTPNNIQQFMGENYPSYLDTPYHDN